MNIKNTLKYVSKKYLTTRKEILNTGLNKVELGALIAGTSLVGVFVGATTSPSAHASSVIPVKAAFENYGKALGENYKAFNSTPNLEITDGKNGEKIVKLTNEAAESAFNNEDYEAEETEWADLSTIPDNTPNPTVIPEMFEDEIKTTLWKLCEKHHVGEAAREYPELKGFIEEVMKINDIKQSEVKNLSAGKKIRFPVPKTEIEPITDFLKHHLHSAYSVDSSKVETIINAIVEASNVYKNETIPQDVKILLLYAQILVESGGRISVIGDKEITARGSLGLTQTQYSTFKHIVAETRHLDFKGNKAVEEVFKAYDNMRKAKRKVLKEGKLAGKNLRKKLKNIEAELEKRLFEPKFNLTVSALNLKRFDHKIQTKFSNNAEDYMNKAEAVFDKVIQKKGKEGIPVAVVDYLEENKLAIKKLETIFPFHNGGSIDGNEKICKAAGRTPYAELLLQTLIDTLVDMHNHENKQLFAQQNRNDATKPNSRQI